MERSKIARELYPSPFDTGSATLNAINRHTTAALVSLHPAPHRFGSRPSIDADLDAARLAELDRNARKVGRDVVPFIFDDVDEPFFGAAMREAGRT